VDELVEFKRRSDEKVLETLNLIESRFLRLRRKLARKVSRIQGANAVIGYRQMICDEGYKSNWVIIRGFGTAIHLEPIEMIPQPIFEHKKEVKITSLSRNEKMSKSHHFNEKKI